MATTIDIENAKQIRAPMDVLIQVTPESGDPIIINNENLIDAVVSLRANLSIIDPTLPESEIEIHAYYDTDISDLLSKIPNETPLTYQAGYPGDMSPVRMFYIDDQITWENNVITIHAVDAVHKLDKEFYAMGLGSVRSSAPSGFDQYAPGITSAVGFALGVLDYSEVDYSFPYNSDFVGVYGVHGRACLVDGMAVRDFLALIMWLLHIDLPAGYLPNETAFWPTYVDAGIPSFTVSKPAPKWVVAEEDCVVTKKKERKITGIALTTGVLSVAGRTDGFVFSVGSGDWVKGEGIFLNPDDYVLEYTPRYVTDETGTAVTSVDKNDPSSYLAGLVKMPVTKTSTYSYYGGLKVFMPDLPQGWMRGNSADYYTQVLPWTTTGSTITQKAVWDSYVHDDRTSDTIVMDGEKALKTKTAKSYGDQIGYNVEFDLSDMISGIMSTKGKIDRQNTPELNLFPDGAMQSILDRSNITGSFVWKGDPRMQPRDVFNFIGLSYDLATEDDDLITDENGNVLGGGSVTECTIESITLTHEGGGTTAEITYREGIC